MTNDHSLDTIAQKYIDNIVLSSDPLHPKWNRENFIFQKQPKWNYIDNCMIRALILLEEQSGQDKLTSYIKKYNDAYVDPSGNIPTIRPEDHNLDNFSGGRNLIWLWKKTGNVKYSNAFEKLFDKHVAVQPRLNCGNFWHKAIYPYQLWLDGAYMALPFMTEYALVKNDLHSNDIIADVEAQLSNIHSLMYDSKTGLYYHGYDETRKMLWADKNTGLSSQFWLRSLGWLCAGLADILELLPESRICREMLSGIIKSMSRSLTGNNMLLQLPARPELENNYPETSGTLLFAYAAMKAYRLGSADVLEAENGFKAVEAVCRNFITHEQDGIPVLHNICLMGGLGGSQNRDGSAEYYLSERIVENDAKGIAPFLMAYNEILRLKL